MYIRHTLDHVDLSPCTTFLITWFGRIYLFSCSDHYFYLWSYSFCYAGFPDGSLVIYLQCRKCRRWRFDPCVGKIGGNGNSLQYSFVENPMERGDWRAAKSQTWLSVRSASAFALQRFAAEDFKNDFLVLFLYSPIVTFSAAFLHLVSLQIFEMVSSQIFQRMQNWFCFLC